MMRQSGDADGVPKGRMSHVANWDIVPSAASSNTCHPKFPARMRSTTRRGWSHTDSQAEDVDASETSGAMVLLFDEAGYAGRCNG
jgi:hypothetical protein